MFQKKQFKHGIRFAWHQPTERMVTAVDVDKGLACNCTCVACDAPLIARQGQERIWHFAHHREANCPYATEAAIHWMAKQMISERGGLFVPHRELSKTVHGKHHVWSETLSVNVQEAGFQSIMACSIEKNIGGRSPELGCRRPDLVARLNGLPLAIEIYNTHAVDFEKSRWLEKNGFSVLEIDVSDLAPLPTDAYKDVLEHRLFGTAQYSLWLAHMGDKEAQDRLKELEQALRLAKQAEEEALLVQLEAQEAARRRKEEVRKRYRDVEDAKLRFTGCTVRIGRNEGRATLKVFGQAPDNLFSKIVDLARHYGGQFNPRGRCWEFYRYSETKSFFDLLCSQANEKLGPVSTEGVRPTLASGAANPIPGEMLTCFRSSLPKYFDDPALQELFDERAAILEYEGGLSRKDAEQQALSYVSSTQDRQRHDH